MSKQTTEIVFILDRSGSMGGTEGDVIGSFNALLKEQQAMDEDIRISTLLFDHELKYLYRHKPVQQVSPMTKQDYYVRGSTALIDAIGTAVEDLIHYQKRAQNPAEKVMFIVNTDGYENASQHFTAREVRTLLKLEQKVYGWEFLFLGANIDAVSVAHDFGFDEDRVANYHNDQKGNAARAKSQARAIRSYVEEGVYDAQAFDEVNRDYKERK